MMKLADWWSSEREAMSGEDMAGLLWCLCSDARPHLERLSSRVSGDLFIRAMRGLRGRASVPVVGTTSGEAPESQAPERFAVASDGPALRGLDGTAAAA
jgi:hypothetical protein